MTPTETARIAAAINTLRPDWPTNSITTFLHTSGLANRPYQTIAIALTWIAVDPTTRTPARALENGPWWRATTTPENTPTPTHPWGPQNCHTCGLPQHQCTTRWKNDHQYTPTSQATKTTNVTARINDLRNRKRPTA